MDAGSQLEILLRKQQEVLSQLQELNRRERECLLNSDLANLDAITCEQRETLNVQAQLSHRINRLIGLLAGKFQLTGRISLARLMDEMKGETADTLRESFRKITMMTEELQREGRVNWYLAQQALKYVDFTLKLVGNTREEPLPYTMQARRGTNRAVQLLMDSCA